jgi:hypothetical protein
MEPHNVFSLTACLLLLFIILRALAMSIIRRRGATCAICHSKFGTSLGEACSAVYPEHMVYD